LFPLVNCRLPFLLRVAPARIQLETLESAINAFFKVHLHFEIKFQVGKNGGYGEFDLVCGGRERERNNLKIH